MTTLLNRRGGTHGQRGTPNSQLTLLTKYNSNIKSKIKDRRMKHIYGGKGQLSYFQKAPNSFRLCYMCSYTLL